VFFFFESDMVESSKKTREVTWLRHLVITHLGNVIVPFEIDHWTGKSSGTNQAQYVSFLGVLTQLKVFILVHDRDHVTKSEKKKKNKKNLIWQDICVSYLFKV